MPNNWFRFRHFIIRQDRCAMKVGTDSVLLGSWFPLGGDELRIADLGTGTGILALIMAQRSKADVVAFESDPEAGMQASENFSASPWPERISCVTGDIRDTAPAHFDVCIFNPPYFNRKLNAPDPLRNQARHMLGQSPYDWMQACDRLLHEKGRVGLIIPTEEEKTWLQAANNSGFFPQLRVMVKGKPGKEVKRILYVLSRLPAMPETEQLTIETEVRGKFTEAFAALVYDIYPDTNR
jgi:tRNA1Val (adenine37-N6)-methyltransferase